MALDKQTMREKGELMYTSPPKVYRVGSKNVAVENLDSSFWGVVKTLPLFDFWRHLRDTQNSSEENPTRHRRTAFNVA